ncbi:MAG: 2-C-methyl-D-erythritol 4-phosphate cytidylyltransferase [Porticoccaceae bacterium]
MRSPNEIFNEDRAMKTWVVVPAAGTGSRFGVGTPKQYHRLAGEPIIVRTLHRLLSLEPEAVVVAVHKADQRWQQMPLSRHPKIRTVHGGHERADSVRAAVASLAAEAGEDDWVLVHDVARPCVLISDIRRLIATLAGHPVGGILATPVSDTIKRVEPDSCQIRNTEDRTRLWSAQTPQLFRYAVLRKALASVDSSVTDEAGAVEKAGLTPLVVEGSRDNIKITRREDIAIATAIIEFQATQQGQTASDI